MKMPWFKRFGIFFIPTSIIGLIILISGFIYAIYVFIILNNSTHSVSDFLIKFVFNLIIIGAVYTLIAYLTSRYLNH